MQRCIVSEYFALDSRLPALSRSFLNAPRVIWSTSVKCWTITLGSAAGGGSGGAVPLGAPGERTSISRSGGGHDADFMEQKSDSKVCDFR